MCKNYKDIAVKLKDCERRTSNVKCRILNKIFCQFISRRSTSVPQHKLTDFIIRSGFANAMARNVFKVGCLMFDVKKTLCSAVIYSLIINILLFSLIAIS